MSKPSGLVTFLFTDIEGSTKLSQLFPETLQSALERHHEILKKAIESNNGFVFDIVGDAFCCAFENAGDAVKSSVKIQNDLADEKWSDVVIKIRIGIHTGNAEWSGERYMGYITLARTARIMSAACGEQILISKDTYENARDDTGTKFQFKDLGERRLKDLIHPLKLYQVSGNGLRENFPPLNTLDVRPNNLPIQLTNFIGRTEELEKTKNLLKQSRLLTLTGPGGTGKTRLALQIAADAIDDFENGVWYVELASVSDPELLPLTVMQVLGITEQPKTSVENTLAEFIANKNFLFVIDNCEHLIDAVAGLTQNLLMKCRGLKIIATSRETLRCEGELRHNVLPLEFPDPNDNESPEILTQYESVRLFIERALAVNFNFRVNNENAPALAQICFKLDGIPLAIELAAAKTKVLSLDQIYLRLNDRFRLLTGGMRTSLPRQQTLRALIDWSYDLLSEDEKILWNRLSVFSGGWTLEAAEEICTDDKIQDSDVIDLLSGLSEKSIIIFDESNGRYKILETIRQYGEDKLLASGEYDQLMEKHLSYYSDLADKLVSGLRKQNAVNNLNFLGNESGNIEKALNWFSGNPDRKNGYKLLSKISYYWQLRGYITEGYRWLEIAINMKSDKADDHFGNILSFAGTFARLRGEFDKAQRLMNESLNYWTETNNESGIADTLSRLGILEYDQSRFEEAIKLHEKSLEICKKTGNKLNISRNLNNLANAYSSCGNEKKGYQLLMESLEIRREIGDKLGISFSLDNLGVLAFNNEEYEKSEKLYTESLEIKREHGNKSGVALLLDNLGQVKSALGEYEKADELFNESIKIYSETGEKIGVADGLNNLALLKLETGDSENAYMYFTESLNISKSINSRMRIADSLTGLGRMSFLKRDYEQAMKYYSESLNIYIELNNIKDTVLVILMIAELRFYEGNLITSAKLFGFSENYFENKKIKIPKAERMIFSDSGKKLREKFNEDVVLKNFEEGKKLSTEEAVKAAIS